jgi:hypothetical protein
MLIKNHVTLHPRKTFIPDITQVIEMEKKKRVDIFWTISELSNQMSINFNFFGVYLSSGLLATYSPNKHKVSRLFFKWSIETPNVFDIIL